MKTGIEHPPGTDGTEELDMEDGPGDLQMRTQKKITERKRREYRRGQNQKEFLRAETSIKAASEGQDSKETPAGQRARTIMGRTRSKRGTRTGTGEPKREMGTNQGM